MKNLKRIVRMCSGMLLVSLLVLSLACPAYAASPQAPIKIFLDGTTLQTDVDPVLKEGRSLVPFRAIGEALMAQVEWDESARKVTLTLGDKAVQLVIGDSTAYVNGNARTLDVPAMLVENRTMVPLRFISESLGASVQWSGELRRIDITTTTTAEAPVPAVQQPLSQVMVYISMDYLDDWGQLLPDMQQTAGQDDDTYSYYLKLLAQPGIASQPVGVVYDYVGMRVVDGPVEKDGITWWKLEGHGKSGWADERCFYELEGEWDPRVESAIAWAIENIGRTDYEYRCLGFVQDAYRHGGLTLTGKLADNAKNTATNFNAAANRDKIVPRGAAVFYDWEGTLGGTTQNWGHVGIALQTGNQEEIDIINALDTVSIDSGAFFAYYADMNYIGWAWIFNKD
ncbi:MAG: copper amine oxidase N-terminal domain-containing protein [Syntrophomonadaceae bacterium]|nr:copper amine oxidase N-terminal domain-containing protein [Bacillota bacterium]